MSSYENELSQLFYLAQRGAGSPLKHDVLAAMQTRDAGLMETASRLFDGRERDYIAAAIKRQGLRDMYRVLH